MHHTAMEHGRLFFETYCPGRSDITVVDVGASDVNGTLRSVAPKGATYIGLDFVTGVGVDVVLTDPYSFPLGDGCCDVVVSTSCMEHAEFFWLSFTEMLRILKPGGLLYMNVPSNGPVHRHPVDCWRFYPDSGMALQNWAVRSGYQPELLESFIGAQKKDIWNDFVAVYVRDKAHSVLYPSRMQSRLKKYENGRVAGSEDFKRGQSFPEDQRSFVAPLRRYTTRLLSKLMRNKRKRVQ